MAKGCRCPTYATDGAAGMDVVSGRRCDPRPDGTPCRARQALHSPFLRGFEIQVRPRSGLALKHGITLPNTPGTIDTDYRGELKCIMINLGAEPFEIRRGDRIAQLVVAPVQIGLMVEVTELGETAREPAASDPPASDRLIRPVSSSAWSRCVCARPARSFPQPS